MAILKGTKGADRLTSKSAAADSLYGDEGNDTLDGGAGGDLMDGGAGNDLYYVNSNSDKVIEASDGGIDTIITTLSLDLTASASRLQNVENVSVNSSVLNFLNITLGGNALDNKLTGHAGADTLKGYGGNDTLLGLAGRDNLQGGAGNDLLDGGAGNDTLLGGTGDDTYIVNDAGDVVTELANEGTDTIETSLNLDLGKLANVENLTLTTGATSGKGNALSNVLKASTAAAVALDGGDGNDTLIGNAGADSLSGGAGNDALLGMAGKDTLDGGLGNDTLDGGADNDTYTDAGGSDTYVMAGNFGQDVITDTGSAVAEADKLVFADARYDQLWFTLDNAGTMTIRQLGSTNQVSIKNWAASSASGAIEALQAQGDTGRLNITQKQIEALASRMAGIPVPTSLDTLPTVDRAAIQSIWTGITPRKQAILIQGGSGNDTLTAVVNGDTLDGGAGNDRLEAPAGVAAIYRFSGTNFGVDTVAATDPHAPLVLQFADTHFRDLNRGGPSPFGAGLADEFYVGAPSQGSTATNAVAITQGSDHLFLQASNGAGQLLTLAEEDFYFANMTFTIVPPSVVTGSPANDSGYRQRQPVIWETFNITDIQATLVQESRALIGSAGSDTLTGGDGNDTLIGGTGDDTLWGHRGNDVLVGGEGNDFLAGGNMAGEDTYVFAGNFGQDTVIDLDTLFSWAQNPRVGQDTLRFDDVSFDKLWFTFDGSGMKIQVLGSPNSVTVRDWDWSITGTGQIETMLAQSADGVMSITADAVDKLAELMKGTAPPASLDDLPFEKRQAILDAQAAQWKLAIPVTPITGTSGNDTLIATKDGDILDGGAGNDRLVAPTGVTPVYRFSGTAFGHDTVAAADAHTPLVLQFTDTNFHDLFEGYGSSNTSTLYVQPQGGAQVNDGTAAEVVTIEGPRAPSQAGTPPINVSGGTADRPELLQATDGAGHLLTIRGEDFRFANQTYILSPSDTNPWKPFASFTTQQDFIWQTFNVTDIKATLAVGNVQLVGTAGNDTLTGGQGNDSLVGGAGNDTLWGNRGDDTLDGGEGNDFLAGGNQAGRDTYIFAGNFGQDTLIDLDVPLYYDVPSYGSLADRLGQDTVRFNDVAFDHLWFTREGNNLKIQVLGSTDSVTVLEWDMYGNSMGNIETMLAQSADGLMTITPASVNALVNAMSGITPPTNSLSELTPAQQSAIAEAQTAQWHVVIEPPLLIEGTDGADRLLGGSGNDTMLGGGGNDNLFGRAGADRIMGGDGNDTLTGGSGNDSMEGGAGDDEYFVDAEGDIVSESASDGGIDRITASVNFDLRNTPQVETLLLAGPASIGIGNALNNELAMITATNGRLEGHEGDDSLYSGVGNDTMWGNEGADTFSLIGNFGQDIIGDTTAADVMGDRIVFQDVNFDALWFSLDSSNHLVIQKLGTDNTIRTSLQYDSAAPLMGTIEARSNAGTVTLDDQGLQALVQAMATIAKPASSLSELSTEQRTTLLVAEQQAWHGLAVPV